MRSHDLSVQVEDYFRFVDNPHVDFWQGRLGGWSLMWTSLRD
jgi:hypothetical protein